MNAKKEEKVFSSRFMEKCGRVFVLCIVLLAACATLAGAQSGTVKVKVSGDIKCADGSCRCEVFSFDMPCGYSKYALELKLRAQLGEWNYNVRNLSLHEANGSEWKFQMTRLLWQAIYAPRALMRLPCRYAGQYIRVPAKKINRVRPAAQQGPGAPASLQANRKSQSARQSR